MVNVSSSVSASLLVLRSTGTSCMRDNIFAAAFLFASFLDVPLPVDAQEMTTNQQPILLIITFSLITATNYTKFTCVSW